MDGVLNKLVSIVMVALAACCLCAMPCAAFADEASHGGATTDGVLVVFEEDEIRPFSLQSGDQGVEESLEDIGLHVTDRFDAADGTVIYAADAAPGQSDEEAARVAAQLPGVAAAQPNYVYYLIDSRDDSADGDASGIAGDAGDADDADSEGLSMQTAAEALGDVRALYTLRANDPYASVSDPSKSPNQYWLYNAKLADAWNTATTDKRVTIAILDAAVDPNHEDLKGNVLTNLAWDAITNSKLNFASVDLQANNGHGTYVAGIAAGVANNGVGIAGASFNANILPVRVFNDNGQSSTLALRYAYSYLLNARAAGTLSGLRVVNMSLGSYEEKVNDRILHDAIKKARDEYGIVTVCAGGNGKNWEPLTDPCYPGDFEECVAVTALNADGTNVYWSDYNQAKDISAPGAAVWSTHPSAASGYASASGTSSASPMVAATFALMFAAVPNATVDEGCEAIYATATPVIDSANDRTKTSGSHGALDAAAALNYLKEHHPWQFKDVSSRDWCYGAVGYAAENGIMSGYADGSGRFGPDDPTLREQAACILHNWQGNPKVTSVAPQKDVKQGTWYSMSVNWAVATGAMNGYAGKNLFGVGDTLTREQVACIIANVAGANTKGASAAKFNVLKGHEETSSWAREAVIWAVDKGVINGIENRDGTRSLDPQGNVTRAQMAAIMMNAIENGIL